MKERIDNKWEQYFEDSCHQLRLDQEALARFESEGGRPAPQSLHTAPVAGAAN